MTAPRTTLLAVTPRVEKGGATEHIATPSTEHAGAALDTRPCLDSTWLDDMAQLEPVTEPEVEYAKLLQLCIEQRKEIEAANKDLNTLSRLEQGLREEIAKLRADWYQKELAYQAEIAELRAALERMVNHGN